MLLDRIFPTFSDLNKTFVTCRQFSNCTVCIKINCSKQTNTCRIDLMKCLANDYKCNIHPNECQTSIIKSGYVNRGWSKKKVKHAQGGRIQ